MAITHAHLDLWPGFCFWFSDGEQDDDGPHPVQVGNSPVKVLPTRLHRLVINKVHNTTGSTCYRCGKSHEPDKCKFKVVRCYSCGKIGHIQKTCRSILQKSTRPLPRDFKNYKHKPVNRLQQEEQINQLCKDNNPFEWARHWSLSITDFRSNIY